MSDLAGRELTPRSRWFPEILLLLALSGWAVGIHFSHRTLMDPDEPRTAIVCRLMAEQGDWLSPHLPAVFHHDYPHDRMEGDLFAYWDKPPLAFWIGAAAMKVLGPTAAAARFPAGLGHIATVLLVYAAGRRLWPGRAGLWAGIVMALAPMAMVFAHIARMDSLMAALMTAMLLAVLHLVLGTNRPWTWTLVLYVAAGLGLLTKGPAAVVLPAAAVGVTVALTGRWGDLWRLHPFAGAVICLAIAAPWYIYMGWRYLPAADGSDAGFLHEFLIRQHLGRATGGEYGHAGHFPGFLLGVLAAGLVPWTIFLPAACARAVRDGWRLRREHPAAILLPAWAAIVVIAFSLSRTQLPHYVLPAIPPLALITGAYLADRLAQANPGGWFRMGLALTVPMGALLAVGAWVGLWYFGYWHDNYAFAAAGLLGIAAAGTWLLLRRNYSAALAFLAAGIVFAATFVFTADPLHIYQNSSTRYEVNVLKKALQPGDAVIAYPYTPYSTAWYLWPRPVPYPTASPPSGAPSVLLLVAEMNQPRRTFCMLQKAATLEVLRREVRWPIRVLSTAPDHTLIVTEPPEKPAP